MGHLRMAAWLASGALGAALLAAPVLGQDQVRFDHDAVVRATIRNGWDLQLMRSLSDDPWSEGEGVGPVDYRVARESLTTMDAAGIAYRVLIPNVQLLIEAERARLAGAAQGRAWFDDYKTYDQISAYADTLVALNPQVAQRVTVGSSLEGRSIFAIKIGKATGGTKPGVIFNGCQHAREWISPMTNMFIADALVRGYGTDARITGLLDTADVYVVPIVNPDGYVYTWSTNRLWRKNRRNNGDGTFGVDLNRNWGYQWGGEGASTSTSSDTYRGTGPFSEPETAALSAFIAARPSLVSHIDFHSYSELILSPWGYTSALPSNHARFVELNTGMQDAIRNVHGLTYTAGPTYTTIYPASGVSSDWTAGARGMLGWGIELRDTGTNGFVLPPDQIVPTGEENLAAVLYLIEQTTAPMTIGFPSGRPVNVQAGAPTPIEVSLSSGTQTYQGGTGKLYYRFGVGGAYVPINLTLVSGSTYRATIPGAACGATLSYYVEASTTAATVVRSPSNAPASVYAAGVQSTLFADGFETNQGWVVGSAQDNASTGVWVRADPVGTAAQPEDDHTASGTQCWVTGQGAVGGGIGDNDVDGGQTTLTSPALGLAGQSDAVISYWRWYSNNQGSNPSSDTFLVDVSANGSTGWVRVETVGPSGAEASGGWYAHQFRVGDFVTPTGATRVRFIAQDQGGGSIVEAALDDFAVALVCPPCPGDWNGDGTADDFDYFDFLNAFFAGEADFNGDTTTDDFDFFDFLNVLNAAC
ncbi:MAG: hypothetical protein JNM07_04925 [Phycisphaerae bacterium]|nr:hypothetical protein [Phycisphaerae bacterium]